MYEWRCASVAERYAPPATSITAPSATPGRRRRTPARRRRRASPARGPAPSRRASRSLTPGSPRSRAGRASARAPRRGRRPRCPRLPDSRQVGERSTSPAHGGRQGGSCAVRTGCASVGGSAARRRGGRARRLRGPRASRAGARRWSERRRWAARDLAALRRCPPGGICYRPLLPAPATMGTGRTIAVPLSFPTRSMADTSTSSGDGSLPFSVSRRLRSPPGTSSTSHSLP